MATHWRDADMGSGAWQLSDKAAAQGPAALTIKGLRTKPVSVSTPSTSLFRDKIRRTVRCSSIMAPWHFAACLPYKACGQAWSQ